MRVWLIEIGEPLPIDGPNVRLLRTGILAETLSARSVDVLWWASSFSHATKHHRTDGPETVRLDAHVTLKLLRGGGYASNVSLARLRDHAQIARAFSRLAPAEPRPDVIVCGLPVPGLCCAAADYAQARGLPLLLDLRDRWPDTFLDLLPATLRWAGRLGLRGMFRQTGDACRRATGLIGVTESFLQWGLACARRERGPWDTVLPIGYRRPSLPDAAMDEARRFWDGQGVPVENGRLTVCFFGTLGRQFALDTVLEACRMAEGRGHPIRLVLCGAGDFADRFRRAARGLPGVLFPGWIDAPRIQTLLERSQAGLAPYRNTPNFVGHIPNKPAEYLSAGLSVLSTLEGEMAELLRKHRCGWTYRDRDAGQLASILGTLADRPQQLQAARVRARGLFDERFDADKVYAEYAEHLDRVASAGREYRRAA